jgi:hypothetical protein
MAFVAVPPEYILIHNIYPNFQEVMFALWKRNWETIIWVKGILIDHGLLLVLECFFENCWGEREVLKSKNKTKSSKIISG